jgi:hypothetical protein
MDTLNILLVLGGICVVWHVTTTILVYNALQKRGVAVSFIWLRAMAPWYAFRYKEITRKESGNTGRLFYHWIASINLALVFAVIIAITQL